MPFKRTWHGPCSVSLWVVSYNFTDKVNVGIIFFRVVEFASFNDMQRALKRLDGTELLGKRLRLTEVRDFLACNVILFSSDENNMNIPYLVYCRLVLSLIKIFSRTTAVKEKHFSPFSSLRAWNKF